MRVPPKLGKYRADRSILHYQDSSGTVWDTLGLTRRVSRLGRLRAEGVRTNHIGCTRLLGCFYIFRTSIECPALDTLVFARLCIASVRTK